MGWREERRLSHCLVKEFVTEQMLLLVGGEVKFIAIRGKSDENKIINPR